ncbi:hypothetical protein V491_05936 [Pseudogymnoascus sp. VKM F-3775]|nr:hypothetical protein V491_05936 [Pseudogymnoascus sp. VKM F-3775]
MDDQFTLTPIQLSTTTSTTTTTTTTCHIQPLLFKAPLVVERLIATGRGDRHLHHHRTHRFFERRDRLILEFLTFDLAVSSPTTTLFLKPTTRLG